MAPSLKSGTDKLGPYSQYLRTKNFNEVQSSVGTTINYPKQKLRPPKECAAGPPTALALAADVGPAHSVATPGNRVRAVCL